MKLSGGHLDEQSQVGTPRWTYSLSIELIYPTKSMYVGESRNVDECLLIKK